MHQRPQVTAKQLEMTVKHSQRRAAQRGAACPDPWAGVGWSIGAWAGTGQWAGAGRAQSRYQRAWGVGGCGACTVTGRGRARGVRSHRAWAGAGRAQSPGVGGCGACAVTGHGRALGMRGRGACAVTGSGRARGMRGRGAWESGPGRSPDGQRDGGPVPVGWIWPRLSYPPAQLDTQTPVGVDTVRLCTHDHTHIQTHAEAHTLAHLAQPKPWAPASALLPGQGCDGGAHPPSGCQPPCHPRSV